MALNPSQLANGLTDVMAHPKATAAQAADAWSQAYAAYAAGATDCAAGTPLGISAAKAALRALLTVAFSSRVGPPNVTAQLLATAFAGFWLLPPMTFAVGIGVGPGVVTLVAGTPILQNGLLALWPTLPPAHAGARQAAQAHAALLHAFTLTVLVAHPLTPPAPPCVLPIL